MTILSYVAFMFLGLIVLAYVGQRSMMYFPTKVKPSITDTGIIGLEEIQVKTEDGLALYGWYLKPITKQKPTVVWFHGNASNVGMSALEMVLYLKAGYGILLPEFRGYAGNPGSPSEQGFYKDGRAFLDWLKESGTDENAIIVIGESIGSGTAVQLATEYSLHTLVLKSPFTSMTDVGVIHYPYLPVSLLLKDRYDNLSKIKKIKSPLIVVHGTADNIVPYRLGETLFNAAPEPKSMITIEGAGHNNMHEFNASDKIVGVLAE